jgi:hypothetical protein
MGPPQPSRTDTAAAPISEGRDRRRIVVRSLASIAVLGAIAATAIVFGNFFTATYPTGGSNVASCSLSQLQATSPPINRAAQRLPKGSSGRISAGSQPGYYAFPGVTVVVVAIQNVSTSSCSLSRTIDVTATARGSASTINAAPPSANQSTNVESFVLQPGDTNDVVVDINDRAGACASAAPISIDRLGIGLSVGIMQVALAHAVASGVTCAINVPFPP